MKKLIFTFVCVIGFSLNSFAQCGSQATQLNTSCGSWCVSVQIQLTGILEIDTRNYTNTGGTMMRKPSLRELMIVADELC